MQCCGAAAGKRLEAEGRMSNIKVQNPNDT
jgi:hypothetical protein